MRFVLAWLVDRWQWPAASLFAGVLSAAIVPLVWATAGPALALVVAQLPLYLLHQFEEHRDDRFRRYVNATIGGGRACLTPMATFIINAVGVWLTILVGAYLAAFVDRGWGTIATDLTIVNGLVHAAAAARFRAYNPGLWTALGLFLPVGGAGLAVLARGGASAFEQAVGLAVAVAVHAAIVAYVVARLRALGAAAAPS